MRGSIGIAALAAMAFALATAAASAQTFSEQSPEGRRCQTIRTCNFSRTAAVRGCLSSYSCRVCRLVKTRCTVGPNIGQRVCEEMRCGWGG